MRSLGWYNVHHEARCDGLRMTAYTRIFAAFTGVTTVEFQLHRVRQLDAKPAMCVSNGRAQESDRAPRLKQNVKEMYKYERRMYTLC